jgi:hypothetical protein
MLQDVTECLYCGFDFPPDPALPEKEFCDQDCYRLYMAYRAMDVYR